MAGANILEKEQISTISAIAAQKTELEDFKAGMVRTLQAILLLFI